MTKEREALDRKLLAVALVVAIGAVTPIVDMTIIGVALHTLSDSFHTGLSTVQWVITGYILTTAMVVPLTGWATEAFGGRRLWLVALAIFTVGSLLCALSWSIGSLIVFRLLQGIGAGLLGPVGTAIVARAAGPNRMGRAMSVVGVPLVLGPVIAPVVGGILLDLVSWRWIFLINLPIGAVAFALSWVVFDRDTETSRGRLDLRGFLLLCPGVTLLVYGLVNVTSPGALTSAAFLVPVLAGAALLAAFVRHALTVEKPLLDLRLLGNITVSSAGAIQFLMNATLSGAMMIFPLYYQLARGESPLIAGLLLVPQGLGVAMTMPIAGRIVDKGRPSLLVLCGIPLLALGFVSFTMAGADGSYLRLGLSLWVIGVGAGCTIMPALTTAYRALEPRRIPHITATFSILQELGASGAVAVFIVVLEAQLAANGAASAAAFETVFWLPLTLVLLCLVPALLAWRSTTPRAGTAEPELAEVGS
ncbi:MAG: DHA2 family efflux MFS transporter permease subunit [Actinophytocola sp.]|uniref:DHA2 family efflux MFS transporter permease subunit n=1 Tax=Actinophytocola sp. TaxID=1872138 RepID=UPI00132A6C0C|nr:DHA2 family efflux MFS transporter permease subunit [Actinophytocola sp.]MPZ81814.1 DHA2 family efflux MFS transporter permease subunit [Actinophytocola sp.]